jgi:hypothetical protein
MEFAQNKSLQEMLRKEFLQAYARQPILTRDNDFARKVGFSFTQKYPASLSYLRTLFNHNRVTAREQRRRQRSLPPQPTAASEIESEAPT